jgi:predicted transcriptional regulator
MRRQFVLDKKTEKLLSELASNSAGNRSMVIRTAVQVLADMEDRLDQIEGTPTFQQMMAKSDSDIAAGRVLTHEEVLRMVRTKRSKGKKR